MNDSQQARTGEATRRAVVGEDYVDRAMAAEHPLASDLQGLLNGFAWGAIWSRPGLERAQRSMITVAMLVALNRPHELRVHLEGALRNGLTPEQIYEVLLHSIAYCGFPAALDAIRVAREVVPDPAG